jgi:hypothetical protein
MVQLPLHQLPPLTCADRLLSALCSSWLVGAAAVPAAAAAAVCVT